MKNAAKNELPNESIGESNTQMQIFHRVCNVIYLTYLHILQKNNQKINQTHREQLEMID